MDIFDALGLDLPDVARSMSVTDADPDDLMAFLAPVFGWEENEASKNSMILFPGESQQGFVDSLGLFETPSVNPASGGGADTKLSADVTASALRGGHGADPNNCVKPVSPFSGVTQFELYPGQQGNTSQLQPADAAMLSPFVQPSGALVGTTAPQAGGAASEQGSLLGLLKGEDAADNPAPAVAVAGGPSSSAAAAASATPIGSDALPMQQQRLVPPPVPHFPLQQQFQPVVSPLLLQGQGLQLPNFQQLSFPAGLPFTLPQQPQRQQPTLFQPVVQQQEPMDAQHEDSDDDDGSGSDPRQQQQHGQQPKRRGRPPKVAGQYSKGYEAIKRYREKKKNMVEHMEQEIAQKREELHKLQAEQQALRSHQEALESTMSSQDRTLAQLLQLKLSFASRDDTIDSTPDLEATTAAALAGVQQALAMQGGGDAAAAAAAAAAVGAERRQKLALKQQAVQQKIMREGPLFLQRYQAYVQAVADRVSEDAAAAAAGAPAGRGSSSSFPTFPFTLVETLSLWQLSRLAVITREAAVAAAAAAQPPGSSSSGGVEQGWDDYTLNLATGQHDQVPHSFWQGVAAQIPLFGEQPQQVLAAWRLYARAMQQLNEERQELTRKLQEAAAEEEANTAAAAAAGAGCGSGTAALDAATVYIDLLDAIERNLLRGRAVVMMYGWSMLCMLSAEQIGRICMCAWPYFPLIRAVTGYILGKHDLTP